MLNRVSSKLSNSPSAGAPPPSKVPQGLHDRLASDLSDSSTESGVAGIKKSIMNASNAAPGGGGVNDRGLGSVGGVTQQAAGGGLNSTGSTTNKGTHQDVLALAEGLDVQRRGSTGMIKVKLASASPQWDNKAEVEVDCENPDEVVDKMLQSIVDKFPPTAVITVEKGGGGTVTGGGGYVPPQNSMAGGPSQARGMPPQYRPPFGGPGTSPRSGGVDRTMLSTAGGGGFVPGTKPYAQQLLHSNSGQFMGFGSVSGQTVGQGISSQPGQPGGMGFGQPGGPYPFYPQQQQPIHMQPQQFPPNHNISQQFGSTQTVPQQFGSNQNVSAYLQHPVYKQQSVEGDKLTAPQQQDQRGGKKHSTASSITSTFPPTHSQAAYATGFQTTQKTATQELIQEVPKFVPKVEVREIIKEVPKVEVEWVEQLVEVPQINYVDKYEEVPQVQEVVKHVPKYETVDIPRDVVKYVPKVMTKIVENVVEVPRGEKIPVMRPQPVDTPFVVPRFSDRNVPVIMSQYIVPEIEETDEVVEVEVSKYVPYLVPVDVYVPLPVSVPVNEKNDGEQSEQPCNNVDPSLLQHLMIEMNPHLQQLEMYNFQQQEQFQSLIHLSIQQARENGVAPPQPVTNAMTVQQQPPLSPSANVTSSFPPRRKTGLSRSSSAGASRRQASRNVSRRVTGTGTARSASQLPPTMMVHPQPPMAGYPPMYQSGMPPMMIHSSSPMQQMPPTIHGSQGFGPAGYVYGNGATMGTGGMFSTGYGNPGQMPVGPTPQVNIVAPDGTPLNGPGEKIGSGRQASRLTNNAELSSRQPSVFA